MIMRSNIIRSTPHCPAAVAFHDGGHDIVFEGNTLLGPVREVYIGKKCQTPVMANNIGMGNLLDVLEEEKFDQ